MYTLHGRSRIAFRDVPSGSSEHSVHTPPSMAVSRSEVVPPEQVDPLHPWGSEAAIYHQSFRLRNILAAAVSDSFLRSPILFPGPSPHLLGEGRIALDSDRDRVRVGVVRRVGFENGFPATACFSH